MALPTRCLATGLMACAASALAGCAPLALGSGDPGPAPQAEGFTPAAEGALYGFGYALGDPVAQQELDDAEIERVIRGLRDRARGRESRYDNPDELKPLIGEFLAVRGGEIAERNRAVEQPFLQAEARAEGSVVTESGAIVRVLTPGQGEPPGPEQTVILHYDAALSDGTAVRSTRKGSPFTLRMERSNRCWREALALAAPGAQLRAVCPSGLSGRFGGVPPGATVVWNLEVLEIRD